MQGYDAWKTTDSEGERLAERIEALLDLHETEGHTEEFEGCSECIKAEEYWDSEDFGVDWSDPRI